jgi:RNA methyltransferase, TrmH family
METLNLKTMPELSRAKLKIMNSLAVKKYRRREGLFVAEGVRLVEEALAVGNGISWAVVAGQDEEKLRGSRMKRLLTGLLKSGVPVYRAAGKDLGRVLDTVQPQPVAAVCKLVPSRLECLDIPDNCLLVVCDAFKEPGNLGAVIRAAAAGGVYAVLAGTDTVDPYSPKCVRASAGALFRLPVVEVDSTEKIIEFLRQHDFTVFEAAAEGESLFRIERFPERTALVLGSEAEGVSAVFNALAGKKLAVPMSAGVESLNVAVAAGVILYEIGRKSGRF